MDSPESTMAADEPAPINISSGGSDSSSSDEPQRELLRTQHATSCAYHIVSALRGHILPLPPPLRLLRGEHICQWIDELARIMEAAAQADMQPGQLDAEGFIPSVAGRLDELQQRLTLLPLEAALDILAYTS